MDMVEFFRFMDRHKVILDVNSWIGIDWGWAGVEQIKMLPKPR